MTRTWCILVLVAGAQSGCVMEDSQGRPVRSTRSYDQPDGLVPRRLVLGVNTALDTDDDGRIDTIPVQGWLFSSDPTYALPIWVDGRISFMLKGAAGQTLDSWDFGEDDTASMRLVIGQIGPGYGVLLKMHDDSGLEPDLPEAGFLSATFFPTEGEPVSTDRANSVLIGATGRSLPR